MRRRPQEERSFRADSPCVDLNDHEGVAEIALRYRVTPEVIAAAVDRVGPNLTAVELWLTAPPPG